ncbi:hypothetical protein H0H93_005621, partial [Arthromyces matolae]
MHHQRLLSPELTRHWTEDRVIPDPDPCDIIIPQVSRRYHWKWEEHGIVSHFSTVIQIHVGLQFINTLASGSTTLPVNDGLDSCTRCINFVPVAHPKAAMRRIVLLDTPGLDSVIAPDGVIFQRIAAWVNNSYGGKVKLAGIIWVHDINLEQEFSVQMIQKNLDQLERLCGNSATKNVLFVTTKWTSPPMKWNLEREAQMMSQQNHCTKGMRIQRLADISADAAWNVVNLSLADAFTFDTEKIMDDVSASKRHGDGRRFSTLENLLKNQHKIAQEWKTSGFSNALSMWDQLAANDRKIRDALQATTV